MLGSSHWMTMITPAVITPGATAEWVQEQEAGSEQMEIGGVAWGWRQRAGTLRNTVCRNQTSVSLQSSQRSWGRKGGWAITQ